jgi:hypothetical protein
MVDICYDYHIHHIHHIHPKSYRIQWIPIQSPEVLNFDWFPSFSSLSGVTGNAPCSCLGSKHLSVGGEHKECYKEIQIYDCHPVYESNSRSLGIPWPNNWSLNFEGFTITIKLCLCNESSFPQNGAIHLSDQIISYQTRWPNTRVVEIMHHKHKWPENVNPCW